MGWMMVDFGIDLGTTNSSVAVLNGTEVRVFDNNDGQKCTPSAVWIDPRGRMFVGRVAKERLEDDPGNVWAEFKRLMGTAQVYRFASTGREMRPEELSAEVLKSLRADVERAGEEMTAAVIGVPAAFSAADCQATERAARLAGLDFSPLIQEPVAAALAYGFQSESDRVFWMVYDLGGGTFDAAIVHVQDGAIRVETHGGDDKLGGKDIDWAIVDRLMVPALLKDHPLPDFRRDNPRWRSAFAKLKLRAEEAKIRLSRDKVCPIIIDPLCQDDRGLWVRFEFELTRSDIEPLIEPVVERTIVKCQAVLAERRLGPGDIERLILVGGPTLIPLLREMLAARLKIPLEFRVDPLTVVAQGAAIFAGTQRYKKKDPTPREGQYVLRLEYNPIGMDPEPLVGGVVQAPAGATVAGLSVEFVEPNTGWRSGRLQLSADGAFTCNLKAQKGRVNEFRVELRDASGRLLDVDPAVVRYTIGTPPTDQSLIHSLGVALASNETLVLLEKGTPLPAKRRHPLRTTAEVRRGQSGTLLRIPIVEGERKRADRNRLIGALEVRGDQVSRDVPVGSEVEVVIEVDASRLVKARAFVPILNQEYDCPLDLEKPSHDPAALAADVTAEKGRLGKIREKAREAGATLPPEALMRIEALVREVEEALSAAAADRDAADKCHSRLLELSCELDDLEAQLRWPALVAKAREQAQESRRIVEQGGTDEERRRLKALEAALEKAVAARDPEVLQQQTQAMIGLTAEVLQRRPEYWVGLFHYLAGREAAMTDRALAGRLIAQGRRCIMTNDLEGLIAVDRQLIELLPRERREDIEAEMARQFRSTVRRDF
ncbi:MAG: Hsp70 family protein [Acetobacteraceae bacterium]|nr:Hsp70 family protein [Acetobacteraceae bacterium]